MTKARIFKALKSIFSRFGYQLVSINARNLITDFYETYRCERNYPETGISSLVFSKDRATQLHAFLASFLENVKNGDGMIVYYKASDQRHEKSYEDLKRIYCDLPVTFLEEKRFRGQLIEIVQEVKNSRICFFVDDMIFTHKVDYKVLSKIDPYTSVVALSRGGDMTYSSVLLKKLRLPTFTKTDNGLLHFSWNEIKEFSDWSYPIGVSGYMYDTKEVLSMFKNIDFKAPNSLEGQMQGFLPIFKNRKGVCPEKTVSVCVHANLTQEEVENPVLGKFSIEDLLERWEAGYQIDHSLFYNIPMTVSQEQHYTFRTREP